MRECESNRGLLAGLLYGELPAEDKARLEAHLPGCAGCREALAAMREASSALDAWTLAPARKKKSTGRRVASAGIKPLTIVAWSAAAAVFLVVLALSLFTRTVDPAPAPITRTPVRPPAPLPPEMEKARDEARDEIARIEEARRRNRERLDQIEQEWKQLLQQKKEDAQRQQDLEKIQAARQKVEEDQDRVHEADLKAQERLVRATTSETVAVVAQLEWVQGEVCFLSATGRVPAKAATVLVSGQGLETLGAHSAAVVKFPDSTRIEISSSTTIREISDGASGKRLEIAAGTIKVQVAAQPAGRPMTIRTTDAEVNVLGTRFRLSCQETTRIDVHEGKVKLLRPKDQASLEISAGNTVSTGVPRLYPKPIREVAFQDGVLPQAAYAGTRDSFLSETYTDHNYGTNPTIQVDGDNPGGSGRELRTVLRWDISTIPPGSRIQTASVVIKLLDRGRPPYEVHALRRSWTETTVSWQTFAADPSTPILGFAMPLDPLEYAFPLSAEGVALIQSWVDSPASNFGLLLTAPKNSHGLRIHARETSDPSKRPKLLVTYTPR